jgi:hypothetical protein
MRTDVDFYIAEKMIALRAEEAARNHRNARFARQQREQESQPQPQQQQRKALRRLVAKPSWLI